MITITDKNDIKYEFASKFYLSKNIAERFICKKIKGCRLYKLCCVMGVS